PGSARPVTAGPFVPRASSARLGLNEKLIVVDPRRASFVDDGFSIDDNCLDVRPATILDQSVDRIAHRAVTRRSKVDDNDVCLGSRRQPSQIVTPEGGGPANRSRVEQIGRRAPEAFLSTRREINEA